MKKLFLPLLLLVFLLASKVLYAFEPFVVKNIEVNGLQRISKAAVLRDIPIKKGQELTQSGTSHIIRALFNTGFFKQIALSRLQNILVLNVRERPSIGKISVTGISQKKPIHDILKTFDLQEGRMFDREKFTRAQRTMERYYLMNGRFGVKIQTKVEKKELNRVALKIEIYEGDAARIKEIKLIGNQAFSRRVLLKEFNTKERNAISWLTKGDRYVKEKLVADLEILQSYYMDRGYVHFQVDSTQVSLSADKKDLYIAIHLSEGEQYYFGKTQVTSQVQVSEENINKAIAPIKKGNLFSRKTLMNVKENVETVWGDEGYYFASVRSIPEINEAEKIVHLTYHTEPGYKIYVRNIHIFGNYTTQDEVIRRELRQMEGSVISTSKVKAGKFNVERKGFSQAVKTKANLVPGTKDQLDLDYYVNEQRLGQLSAGIGYSASNGFSFDGSVIQKNFFGTGKSGNLSFNKSRTKTSYSAGYYNPYYTVDGVGFGIKGYYDTTDLTKISSTLEYSTSSYNFSGNFNFPLSEFEAFRAGIGYEDLEIKKVGLTLPIEMKTFFDQHGTRYKELSVFLGWNYDSLDNSIFPTEGLFQSATTKFVIPGMKVVYYLATYDLRYYYPLNDQKSYILKFSSELGYGDGYGKTNRLPFYRNFFAGGAESVRAYDERSLGPKDSTGRVLGGNALVSAKLELIFPTPITPYSKTIRTALFLDAGQVYDTNRISKDSSAPKAIKFGAGISLAWNSPLGAPLLFSLGYPLNYKEGEGDKRIFAFSFASSF